MLGIDDGPFEKGQPEPVPIVGVMMEGSEVVESVATTRFPVDGADATDFLASWISGLRSRPSLHAVMLGGVTIAGLGTIDLRQLSARLGVPVLSVTRRDPQHSRIEEALEAAPLVDRISITRGSPRAERIRDGLFVAFAGVDRAGCEQLIGATTGKSNLPEPLRLAHLVARAMVTGESRGRV